MVDLAKRLVAYFSATGTTGRVAERLAKAAGADLYQIVPAKAYTRADLDWNDASSRTSVEKGDESSRPALAGGVPDVSGYDVVFVGFPIWWYVEPRIVDTFLEACDLSGKTVVAFATSGGSGISGATKRIRTILPKARVLEGRALNGAPSQRELSDWVDGLGL
ncbi:flavodoxin [Olsenella sp. CA-Schmier-601-WT-1]|uniref:Flavodoxin n=2 Tax=Olsenella porci TaxID=2652279 RepID=A0A6N7XQQ1_9ACTN|nr:flavodoxin [Olsenella porci]